MTPKEALNNIATISEILVEVSKSHIMDNEAINEIRGLDISGIYFTLKQALNEHKAYELADYYKDLLLELMNLYGDDLYVKNPSKWSEIGKLFPKGTIL